MEAAAIGMPLSFKRLADGFGISVQDNQKRGYMKCPKPEEGCYAYIDKKNRREAHYR
jgi:hypothetical protein